MKVEITVEFERDTQEETLRELGHILGTATMKVYRQLQRAPGCLCTAPEADDVLRDIYGNVVGTVSVEG